MAAIMISNRRSKASPVINYPVMLDGRRYRVCTLHGRVLMVARKTVRSEVMLEVGKQRWREVVRLAAKEHKVELRG